MLKKVEGIIVSSINYGETSKIINILTIIPSTFFNI